MEQYFFGSVKTLAVGASSVYLVVTDVKPTSGEFEGKQAEVALVRATGPLYVEAGGGDASVNSFPMAAGDSIEFEGYQNIKNLRFIRNTNSTTLVWIPGYR